MEFEAHLAAHQHDVGYVGEFPFDPGVPAHTRVVPKPYQHEPEKRQWLRTEMQQMCDHGVLERTDDVTCAGGVVLVEGQKEGTRFRFCTDFRDINARSAQKVYPLPDIPQIIDQSRGCDLWSLIDLKSGFYNVPVKQEARRQLGIAT